VKGKAVLYPLKGVYEGIWNVIEKKVTLIKAGEDKRDEVMGRHFNKLITNSIVTQ